MSSIAKINTAQTAATLNSPFQAPSVTAAQGRSTGFDSTDRLAGPGDLTIMPPRRPFWSRFRFDRIVDGLLTGNTSIRDWQARDMSLMIMALPNATEAVHAARGLAKLRANGYIKSDTSKQILHDALYGALTQFDTAWAGRGQFDALVGELLQGRGNAAELANGLKSIEDKNDLVHAMRALYKLSVNGGLGGANTQDKILSELYGKMIQLSPRYGLIWRNKERFDTLANGLLSGREPATAAQAKELAELVGSVGNAEQLVYVTRTLEKLRANNYFNGSTLNTVGSAVYDQLTKFDVTAWKDQTKFDQLVGDLFKGSEASVEQAKLMASMLESATDAQSAVHAMRAIEKLQANGYFNGEAKSIVDGAIYDVLTRVDVDVVILPLHAVR